MRSGSSLLLGVALFVSVGCTGATLDSADPKDYVQGDGSEVHSTHSIASEAQYADEGGETSTTSPSVSEPSTTGVPTDTVEYGVTITGTTFNGNTNFPTDQTTYTQAQDFQLTGKLIVTPGIDQSGANFDNGVNPQDIGLVVGNPAGSPEAGSVWFATNTEVFVMAGFGGESQEAQLDVASVDSDEAAGTLSIQVDPNAARTSQLNSFNVEGGLVANVYQILSGNMQLQFEDDGNSVSGSADFVGSGYIEPSSARVQATISGTLQ